MNDREFLGSVTEYGYEAAPGELEDLERGAVPLAIHHRWPNDRPLARHRAHDHLGGELGPPIVGDRGGGPGLVDRMARRRGTRDGQRRDEHYAPRTAVAGGLEHIGGPVAIAHHELRHIAGGDLSRDVIDHVRA